METGAAMKKSEIFHQVAESSLSRVMERSEDSEAVVALGKKLVAELELADSVDTLGRWMAHYVAGLMHGIESETGADRLARQTELRDAVLALWEHRFELPNGTRPFRDFEPILRALESLDPESTSFRYFLSSQTPDDESSESEEARQWLELAKSIDRVSRMLICHCLASAANAALDKSMEWVSLAERAGIDDNPESMIVRFVVEQSDLSREPDPNDYQRSVLQERYEKLETFRLLAAGLADDIKKRLSGLAESTQDQR